MLARVLRDRPTLVVRALPTISGLSGPRARAILQLASTQSALALPAVLALALAACSSPAPPVPIGSGARDAQRLDGGTPEDALDGGALDGRMLEDAAGLDGGTPEDGGTPADEGALDGMLEDASALDAPDAGGSAADGGGRGFDPSRCRVGSDDLVTLAIDSLARDRDVGVAAGASRFAIAFSSRQEGFENVRLVEIPATGPVLAAAESITTGTALERDPVLAPNGSGWIVSWYGNPEGDFDTYAIGWQDGRIAPGSARVRLSARVGRDDQPAIVATPSGALAAWVEARGAAMDERVPVTRMLLATATPSGEPRDAAPAGAGIGRIAIEDRAEGYLLAWVDSSAAAPSPLVQALDASGTPRGAPISIGAEGNADGTIDLATSPSGGAVVFGASVAGIRPEVRARLVDREGAPSGPERVITPAPSSGRDASIAALAGGYAVAYRELGSRPTLRIVLLDALLAPVGSFEITAVRATGGRVTIRASGEGRMIVGWADVDAASGTTAIRAARIRCDGSLGGP